MKEYEREELKKIDVLNKSEFIQNMSEEEKIYVLEYIDLNIIDKIIKK